MKRKTNLFYVNGPDSKFLTFSNYTESLTGNFLSTDTKLFPDKFLCLKLNGLNATTKSQFIKYLATYYENKLAILRDDCVKYDNISEQHELPLAYLLEAILNVCDRNANGFTITIDSLANPQKMTKEEYNNIKHSNNTNLITYIGNITEQDYNGTYTDTICNINANEYYEGNINFYESLLTSSNTHICTLTENTDKLYGWENEQMYDAYDGVAPLYDYTDTNTGACSYSFDSYLDNIKFVKQPIYDNENNLIYKNIEFNIIIPLFTITNMNYNTNESILEDEYYTENGKKYPCIIVNSHIYKKISNENTSNDNYLLIDYKSRKDVPLGIWLYADEDNDTFITLKRDNELNVYPSWSLLIGSQFKPFPYSLRYEKENATKESILHSYATFAETLTKINDVLDSFNQINLNINKLDERISSLERQIKDIGTNSDISNMKTYMFNVYKDTKSEIDSFKQQLHGYIDNITWSSKSKNNN